MTSPLLQLTAEQMRTIANLLQSGGLGQSLHVFELSGIVPQDAALAIAHELRLRHKRGSPALVDLLNLLAEERDRSERQALDQSLVWTGPTAHGLTGRDTRIVVRELFESARTHVIVSTYIMFNGQELFEPLARRMAELPDLRVQIFANIAPDPSLSRAGVITKFAQDFRWRHWPWSVLPEVYFDPRSLDPDQQAVLHAKCVVVDGKQAFITSANFTESATERNVEVGILTRHPAIPRQLSERFVELVEAGLMERVSLS